MTEKEFNLSEKIYSPNEYQPEETLDVKDVKEFIRRLRIKFRWENWHRELCEEIDKLLGKKLI